MTNIERTLNLMEFEGKLVTSANFSITEQMLLDYIDCYSEVTKSTKGLRNRSEVAFARKLAGLNLLKLKLSRGATFNTCKEGLLYFIENPSYKDFYKVGMTIDLIGRLNSYQTYDPHRSFKIAHYDFVLDRRKAESIVLNSFNVDIVNGEWIKKISAPDIISKVNGTLA